MSKRADSWVCRSRAAPAVRTVTESSRAGAGLCSEPVQQAVIVSPISPMAWPDVTLARAVCLFSTFSAAHKNKHVVSHRAKGVRGGKSNPRLVTKTLQQCNIHNSAGVPPSHGYQWCLTWSAAGKTDMAAPLLFPYVWDTVQQMHKSSLAIYFCSAYHVEKLISTSISDSWARDVPFAHMEPITSANSFLRLRKLFDVYMQVLRVGTRSRQILLPRVILIPPGGLGFGRSGSRWGGSEVRLTK